ncbi:MAG: gliding motility protein GldM [Cruoricaptor ignavus]|nr:gliding motility protein GldM [Cruoricaptor ignavus]
MAATASGAHGQRQKMISLMYLVFIAMLAIQIDQEIIRSYNDTNDALTNTRELTQYKNNTIFERTLDAKAVSSPEKYEEMKNIYGQIKVKSDDIVNSIEKLKDQLKAEAGYDNNQTVDENFTALNNTEASSNLLFNESNENKPSEKITSIKTKIEELRKFINQSFSAVPDMKNVVNRANANLVTEFAKGETRNGKNWTQYKFYGQPLIAALSNLEVMQSEVRNVQSDALVLMLQEKVDADIKFDAFQAIVSAPTNIIQGEQAQAKVAIGNYSSSVPGLSMPGLSIQNGVGTSNLNSSSLGTHTFKGEIAFQDANGKEIRLPYSHTYNVIAGAKEVAFESGALLSADKMNVLYRGLPNPVSGSILGADNASTSLSASGASVSKTGGGTWTVTPGAGNTATLTISGKGPKGQAISKAFTFRIKNIPPPVGQIRGQSVISVPASSIPNQTVSVAMPDFDFPVSFAVNSFMFKVPGKPGMQVSGSSLSSVAGLVKNLRSGDIAYVYNISATATGLGGQTLKQIPPIVINVQ